MNRLANQGARWAAVNNWPPYASGTTTRFRPRAARGAAHDRQHSVLHRARRGSPHTKARLQDVLRCQVRNPSTLVSMCYPGVSTGNEHRGDPVKIKLTAPYKFWFVGSVGITLTASATMRLEQEPESLRLAVPMC